MSPIIAHSPPVVPGATFLYAGAGHVRCDPSGKSHRIGELRRDRGGSVVSYLCPTAPISRGAAAIGFTVSLFITGLAFDQPRLISDAKVAILAASVVAGAAGFIYLSLAPGEPEP